MKENLISNIGFIVPTTAAILLYAAPLDSSTLLPSKFCSGAQEQFIQGYPWEQMAKNQFYSYDFDDSNDMQNFLVIQNFAKKLLKNLKELDPIIAEKVNENFWKLI